MIANSEMFRLLRVLSMKWLRAPCYVTLEIWRLDWKRLIRFPNVFPFEMPTTYDVRMRKKKPSTSETPSEPRQIRWFLTVDILKERQWVPRRTPRRGTFRRHPVTGRARIPRGPVAGTPVLWRWRTGHESGVRPYPNSWSNIRLLIEARSVIRASPKK